MNAGSNQSEHSSISIHASTHTNTTFIHVCISYIHTYTLYMHTHTFACTYKCTQLQQRVERACRSAFRNKRSVLYNNTFVHHGPTDLPPRVRLLVSVFFSLNQLSVLEFVSVSVSVSLCVCVCVSLCLCLCLSVSLCV